MFIYTNKCYVRKQYFTRKKLAFYDNRQNIKIKWGGFRDEVETLSRHFVRNYTRMKS